MHCDMWERTVQVEGLPHNMTPDTLELVFESKKRSGGGEVEASSFLPQWKVAWVTFKHARDAARVLLDKREIDFKEDSCLKVSRLGTLVVHCDKPLELLEIVESYFQIVADKNSTLVRACLPSNEDNLIYIRFGSPEAMYRILQEKHSIRGVPIQVGLPNDISISSAGLDDHTNDFEEEYEAQSAESSREASLSSLRKAMQNPINVYNWQASHEVDPQKREAFLSSGLISEPFSEAYVEVHPDYLPRRTNELDELRLFVFHEHNLKLTTDENGTHTLKGPWLQLEEFEMHLSKLPVTEKTRSEKSGSDAKPDILNQHYRSSKYQTEDMSGNIHDTQEGNSMCSDRGTVAVPGQDDSSNTHMQFMVENNGHTVNRESTREQEEAGSRLEKRLHFKDNVFELVKLCSSKKMGDIQERYGVSIRQSRQNNKVVIITGKMCVQASTKVMDEVQHVTSRMSEMKIGTSHIQLSDKEIWNEINKAQSLYSDKLLVSYMPDIQKISITGIDEECCMQTQLRLLERFGMIEESERSIDEGATALPVGVLYRKCLSSGLAVEVHEGDITKVIADIIVNAANEKLAMTNGVAKAIAVAAGQELVAECKIIAKRSYPQPCLPVGGMALTTGGKLQCKRVIHAVGPRWGDYTDKRNCIQILYKTFLDCLKLANSNRARSIAIPAISSGISAVPKLLVAKAIYDAAVQFDEASDEKTTLQKIIIITIDHEINEQVARVFKQDGKVDISKYVAALAQGTSAGRTPRGQHHEMGKSQSDELTKVGGFKESPTNGKHDNNDNICFICKCRITNSKTLKICKHTFCKKCIDSHFELYGKQCPICGHVYGVLKGDQPDNASMRVTKDNAIHLSGFRASGTHVIKYDITSGIQGPAHPHPGRRYRGAVRTAYLPANKEGNDILKLLRKAFDAGLIFTVGHSATRGEDDAIVWSDIPHKTRIDGGPSKYGYPDDDYLQDVRAALNLKGIK